MKPPPASWLAKLLFTLLAFIPPADGAHFMPDPPPGQLIDAGGHNLHIVCVGSGAPVVILDSGVGGFSLEWTAVQRLLATETRVCAYDRAGYAWSDPGPLPRTTGNLVKELHSLLHNAGLAPPYILAGHSFGGYNALYFAKRFPEEIAGLVLVDSSHPDQTERLPDLPARRNSLRSSTMVTFFQGQSNLERYPEDILPMVMHALSSLPWQRTQREETMNFALSAQQVRSAGPLPDVPLEVLSRGKRVWPQNPYGDALEWEWQAMQKELAALTDQGRQVIAEESGHMVHLDQPELVAEAILAVLRQAQKRGPHKRGQVLQ